MTEHKQTPGLFLIHCRLLPPYSETASQFLKWFKLHYRDIASLPADPIKGLITHGVPYLAPDTDPKYGHDDSKMPPYYFTCMLTDCAYLGTGPYVQMSRRLDLENTREMVDGEVAVGKEGMVFDVVDARFAVYELVDTGDKITSPPYQTLPLAHTTPPSSAPLPPPPTHVISISLKTPTNSNPDDIIALQSAIEQKLAPVSPEFYTSLYKFRKDFQPAYHPEIIKDESENWEIVALMLGEGLQGREEVDRGVEEIVKGWVGGKEGVEVKSGVWDAVVIYGHH